MAGKRIIEHSVRWGWLTFCLAVTLAVLAGVCYAETSGDAQVLQVYLPRQKVMTQENLTLGSVAVLMGDEKLRDLAKGLGLGKFAVTGQQIVIDRETIRSRLAGIGIGGSAVVITGAETVTLMRDEETVPAERIIEAAQQFLDEHHQSGMPKGDIVLVREPEGLPVPRGGGDIRLLAREGQYSRQHQRRIWVGIFQDGKEVGGREVLYSVSFKQRRLIASIDIPKGGMIGPGNTEIEVVQANEPQAAGWEPPYGLVAQKFITKGRVIDASCAGPAEAPLIIQRRQAVLMKIETPGLYITSSGVAMEDGRIGDIIRLRSDSGSGRVVAGRVMPDGTVEPIF